MSAKGIRIENNIFPVQERVKYSTHIVPGPYLFFLISVVVEMEKFSF